jgi:hypothetical protein
LTATSVFIIAFIAAPERRRISNARSKNISFRSTGTKYSMVRLLSAFGSFVLSQKP